MKISAPRESDWLVLVAMMLIYHLPAWSLEEFRIRNRSTNWSGLNIYGKLSIAHSGQSYVLLNAPKIVVFPPPSPSRNGDIWGYFVLAMLDCKAI